MIAHNHDQYTDCTPTPPGMSAGGCPAYGTPWEVLIPEQRADTEADTETVGALRLIAQQDQADAGEQEQTREEQSWAMHVSQHEAATFYNTALGARNMALGSVYESVGSAITLLSTVTAVAVLVRLVRKGRA